MPESPPASLAHFGAAVDALIASTRFYSACWPLQTTLKLLMHFLSSLLPALSKMAGTGDGYNRHAAGEAQHVAVEVERINFGVIKGLVF